MENRKDGGIGAQTFQVLVDKYHQDKGVFRRVLMTEILPLADEQSPFGDIARRVLAELVRAGVMTQEDIDHLKSQL